MSTFNHVILMALLLLVAFVVQSTIAMIAFPEPFEETQPDGTKIMLQIHGDESFNYVTDTNGYAVVRSNDGTFVYATQQNQNGALVAEQRQQYKVGEVDPTRLGIPQNKIQRIQTNDYDDNIDCTTRSCRQDSHYRTRPLSSVPSLSSSSLSSSSLSSLRASRNSNRDNIVDHRPSPRRPTNNNNNNDNNNNNNNNGNRPGTTIVPAETKNNLVIPLLWSDHVDRPRPSQEDLDILMNHDGPHYLCPTGSLRDVYMENSGGRLGLQSTVVDWILMDKTEIYYSGGESGLTSLMHDAIRYALDFLDSNGFDFKSFDENNDGIIDSITFLHSGYGAEWSRVDSYGRYHTDRIWSHKWALFTGPFYSWDGVRVFDYHISPALWGTSGSEIGRIGVIAHETGHFLGIGDLYDRNGGGNGLGFYGMMANSWGFDRSQRFPPHFSAWSKIRLGWITPETPQEGVNMISATEVQFPNHPQIYKIEIGYNEGEYLLIENRQPFGFDSKLPQGGLMIYHIDDNVGFDNEGYPGQPGWPENGNRYRVAIIQADGSFDLERGTNAGDGGDVFHSDSVSHVGPSDEMPTRQSQSIYPNTDAYAGNFHVSTAPTIYITDISKSGIDMSFRFHVGTPNND